MCIALSAHAQDAILKKKKNIAKKFRRSVFWALAALQIFGSRFFKTNHFAYILLLKWLIHTQKNNFVKEATNALTKKEQLIKINKLMNRLRPTVLERKSGVKKQSVHNLMNGHNVNEEIIDKVYAEAMTHCREFYIFCKKNVKEQSWE
jgi:hypothetical protein